MGRDHFDFKTKKSLGQNFLEDQFTIDEIARLSMASKDDIVVEIGPGLGVLTDALAERAGKVIAVELDDRLIPILNTKFALVDNVDIVHQDILQFDWSVIDNTKTLRIVGNLPYYITTPILLGLLEKKVNAKIITVMVQKEVADKIVVGPKGTDYGVLAVSLQYYANCTKVLDVPSYMFKPAPKVDSAVVRLDVFEEHRLPPDLEKKFFMLVKKAFSQRRKTLSNSLAGYNGLTKEEIETVLNNIAIDPKRRAESLSVDDYVRLCKEIENVRH